MNAINSFTNAPLLFACVMFAEVSMGERFTQKEDCWIDELNVVLENLNNE